LVRALVGRMAPRADANLVPVVTFTDPALATVGLSEAEARKRHRNVQVLRAPFVENDLAEAERLPAGMIKVMVAGNGQILGAAIVGRNAGELIAPWSLAIANNLPIAAMGGAAAPYPTRSEISRRVAATFKGPRLTGVWPRRIIGFFRKPGRAE
jgi:pyruvate/2-oxoglutarate dehydrogenase complex dihydrolipoamide dehydrogenase (E3) component